MEVILVAGLDSINDFRLKKGFLPCTLVFRVILKNSTFQTKVSNLELNWVSTFSGKDQSVIFIFHHALQVVPKNHLCECMLLDTRRGSNVGQRNRKQYRAREKHSSGKGPEAYPTPFL